MTYATALTARLAITDLDRAELEELFDELADNLHGKEGNNSPLLDSDVAIDFGAAVIEISVTASGTTVEAANALAEHYVTAALTETGGVFAGEEPEPEPAPHALAHLVVAPFGGAPLEVTHRQDVLVH